MRFYDTAYYHCAKLTHYSSNITTVFSRIFSCKLIAVLCSQMISFCSLFPWLLTCMRLKVIHPRKITNYLHSMNVDHYANDDARLFVYGIVFEEKIGLWGWTNQGRVSRSNVRFSNTVPFPSHLFSRGRSAWLSRTKHV